GTLPLLLVPLFERHVQYCYQLYSFASLTFAGMHWLDLIFSNEALPDDGVQIANFDENTMINQGTSEWPLPQLTFHQVHGANIQILRGGRVAKRKESFCKGLAFSSRPIQIDEQVCIRFSEVVTNWSGVLRFGVTNVDPQTFTDVELPKFACPDLTSKDGYWAKALPERYSVEGSILHFYVNAEGELYYGINGVLKGQFLNGINVLLPLWVIVDIYGNSSSLEFVDPSDVRIRPTRSGGGRSRTSRASSSSNAQTSAGPSTSVVRPSRSSSSSSPNLPSSKYHAGVAFSPLTFHSVRGKHITLSHNYTVAERYAGEYACGYVFTSRPLVFNEKIVIQILDVESAYTGSMAFGLTCCDPITVQSSSLPVDSDDLLERPEYWVSIKDVGAQPKATDELSFWMTEKGEVYFAKNNLPPRIIIHVDTEVRLWAFFDVYGSTQRIRLLGAVKVGSTSAVQQRVPPLPATRGTRLLLDLSPEPRPHRAPSADLTTSTRPSSISQLVRSGHSDEAQTGMTRRTQSETGNRFNGPFLHMPFVTPAERRPILTSLRDPQRPMVSDPQRAVLPPPTGDDLLVLLENIDTTTTRPPFPPPIPARSSPARIPPVRPLSVISPTSRSQQPLISGAPTTAKSSPDEEADDGEECKICMSAKVNCVIYTCGHMSTCFECATETWRVKGECPICRKKIDDVIKIYKS
uniref:Neuralized n=2 Tax=Parascaris univalens TaxID=6257 RepID=A0A915AX19_PARUN